MRTLTNATAAVLALLVLSGCSSDTKAPSGGRIDGLKTFNNLKNDHKGGRLAFAQKPPVGGAHSSVWLRCDVYTSPVPDESVVHSLEHGAVWLTYQPGLAEAEVATLVKLDEINRDYVIVSPYPGQSSPVMATGWGLQLSVESASDPRLSAFVKAYAGGGQGGEPGADCRNQGATPEQAEQFITQGG